MTDEIEYEGTIYKTREERNAALALVWMTAKGKNTEAEIDEYISSGATPETAATDCIEAWELLEPGNEAGNSPSPLFTRDEVMEAFKSFWNARPDRLTNGEPLPAKTA